jgi:hypothetical protein
MTTTTEVLDLVLERLDRLAKEIAELRQLVTETLEKEKQAQPATLRGIWKGIEITDEEIEEVKTSWERAWDKSWDELYGKQST